MSKNPIPKNFQKHTEAVKQINDGVIGTGNLIPVVKEKNKKEKVKKEYNMVAIFSSKNVSWEGVGSVHKGYNIVPRESVEKWLSRDHVREATPKEIAEEYGL